jgi:hypothetical protein
MGINKICRRSLQLRVKEKYSKNDADDVLCKGHYGGGKIQQKTKYFGKILKRVFIHLFTSTDLRVHNIC